MNPRKVLAFLFAPFAPFRTHFHEFNCTCALRDAFAHCHTMDAPLSERLDAYSKAVRTHIPDYADAVDRLAERLTYNNAGATAPQSGDPMPPFVLPDESGRLVSSASLLTRGPVAITFHRGHWCPWCRISVMALAQVQDEIARTGGQVVAIVPERQKFAAELKARTKSPFAVLTDMDNGYALSAELGDLGRPGSGTVVGILRTRIAGLPGQTPPGCCRSRRHLWSHPTVM